MISLERAKFSDAELITSIKTAAFNLETKTYGSGGDGGAPSDVGEQQF